MHEVLIQFNPDEPVTRLSEPTKLRKLIKSRYLAHRGDPGLLKKSFSYNLIHRDYRAPRIRKYVYNDVLEFVIGRNVSALPPDWSMIIDAHKNYGLRAKEPIPDTGVGIWVVDLLDRTVRHHPSINSLCEAYGISVTLASTRTRGGRAFKGGRYISAFSRQEASRLLKLYSHPVKERRRVSSIEVYDYVTQAPVSIFTKPRQMADAYGLDKHGLRSRIAEVAEAQPTFVPRSNETLAMRVFYEPV